MAASGLARVPFWLMALVLAAIAVGVVVVGLLVGLHLYALALLVIPGALAATYMVAYARLPYVPPVRAPSRAAVTSSGPIELDGEEFEDPVEEADRLDRGPLPPEATSAPDEPDA
ncbi:MAG TPA: hypothetical protein VEL82_04955 [Thermoplasmata archaeon]|nr:hypothetical protein [Thermoplasmata archaeon]